MISKYIKIYILLTVSRHFVLCSLKSVVVHVYQSIVFCVIAMWTIDALVIKIIKNKLYFSQLLDMDYIKRKWLT